MKYKKFNPKNINECNNMSCVDCDNKSELKDKNTLTDSCQTRKKFINEAQRIK